jgi:hypothetical protein
MDMLQSEDLWLIGINALVVLVVVFNTYLELGALLGFVVRTSGREGFLVTRVYRSSVRLHYVLFLLTGALLMTGFFLTSIEPSLLVAVSVLCVGFFVNAMVYQTCFVNNTGLGGVSSRYEMEIQWNEIASYEWSHNRLTLRLKGRRSPHRFRFYDTSVMLAVNDRLKALDMTPTIVP